MADKAVQSIDFRWEHKDLVASFEGLLKASADDPAPSSQPADANRKSHPFNRRAVINFKNTNAHHSRCIETKVAATVGLGHVKNKVYDALDPLCKDDGWQSVQNDACEDFWQVGDGYLEVVREAPGGSIKGLYHLPAADVFVFVDDPKLKDYHYEVITREGPSPIKMARFGDLEDAARRLKLSNLRSEVINISRPTSLSRWYGYADWLSGVTSVEIVQMLDQYVFDFFLNRCVPEFLLLFLKQTIQKENWEEIQKIFKKQIGPGNSHKTAALNIPGEIEVQLHKLGLETQSEGMFTDYNDALAMRIVSAHGVPPLLAGIQIPGKLGATNELPNALMAFQALVVGQAQRTFTAKLDVTLGAEGKGGKGRPANLSLKRGDFEYKKITDEIIQGLMSSVGQQTGEGRANPLDTMSRMRTSAPVAAANGRDLGAGVKS